MLVYIILNVLLAVTRNIRIFTCLGFIKKIDKDIPALRALSNYWYRRIQYCDFSRNPFFK